MTDVYWRATVDFTKEKTTAARISVLSNLVLTVAKLATGLATHSVGILAEAIHSGMDLVAALIAFLCVRESGKPADKRHCYGHGKIECLSGMAEALLIFGAAGYILFEAVQKLRTGHFEIEELGVGIAVMAGSAVVNYFVSNHLYRVSKKTDSMALEADALHLRTDVYTSAGILAGLIAIKMTGLKILDPVFAIVVALLILKAAYDLTMNAINDLLDTKIPDEEEALITSILHSNFSSIVEFHNLRTRKSGNIRYIDFHMVFFKNISLEESHRISHVVSNEIMQRLPGSRILVHTEPCKAQCAQCAVACPEAPPDRQKISEA